MRPPSIDEGVRVRLAALLGVAPALNESTRRLMKAFGAQAIFDQGLGHRQAVGLGGAPAFGGEAAVERNLAAGAGYLAGSGCCHEASLRAVECQGKTVIKSKANPCRAAA